jgi:hypothetical protein
MKQNSMKYCALYKRLRTLVQLIDCRLNPLHETVGSSVQYMILTNERVVTRALQVLSLEKQETAPRYRGQHTKY